jgi:CheY-like chemotaxis protein
MSVSVSRTEDDAKRAIVVQAIARLRADIPATRVVADALQRFGAEIPEEEASFHAFASGPLYDAFANSASADDADALMADVADMWEAICSYRLEAQPPSSQRAGELTGITVLVVDDDVAIRRTLARALPYFGAEVHTAGDTAGALRLMKEHHPHVIVTDYDMPGESGATFATMIALTRGDAAPPIICLTGVVPTPTSEAFFEVLPKPTSSRDLVARIRAAYAHSLRPRDD